MTRSSHRPDEGGQAPPPAAWQGAPASTAPGVDLCQPGAALRVLVAAQAAAAAVVLLVAPSGGWLGAQSAASFATLLASVGWIGGLCAARRLLWRHRPALRAALAAAWGATCALAGLAAVAWAALADAGLRGFAGAAACGALAGFTAWRSFELRSRLALPAQAQARLAQLQARIRPHFLFNALNAALALVRVDPDRAERVLEDLSVLFRQAMAEAGSAVPLATEIELARRYLDIEQVRFGDRLRVTWDIDESAGGARVPPLVLQPLVENAVRHGVEPSPDGADVQIAVQRRQGLVQVTVSNTLSDQVSVPGSGMALANVAERLALLHDVGAHVDTRIDDGRGLPGGTRRFLARLTLPL